MDKKLFIALSTFAKHGTKPLELLKESGFEFFLNPLGKRLSQDELVEMGKGYDGVVAGLEPYNDYVLDKLPNLRCISRCGVGIDNISLNKAKEKGVEILNTPDVVIQPVAELTIGLIFDLLRRLTLHTTLMKSHKWERKTGSLLRGKKVGILGLGRIGKKVAEILNKLDAKVYGADVNPDHQWAEANGVNVVSVDDLLAECDILSIHLSQLAEHDFKLGSGEIAMMKQGALVINVSRGQFVDEEALYVALKDQTLGGAALDVYSTEPYSGKLCELDNVVLTPHIATLTEQSRLEMELEATQNLLGFFTSQ